jgi:RHS repeat-associated protein
MRAIKQSTLAVLAATSVVSSALGAPGGLSTSAPPTPTYHSDAPKPREAGHSVSADGTATYVVPFDVPPGVEGAQPSVALHYSSRAPLRGGIAAGWSLPVPMISVDTSEGRLAAINYAVGGRRLIQVNEPGVTGIAAFRLDGDPTYTRYEHRADGTEPGYWVARELSGAVHVFGQAPSSKDLRVEGSALHALYGGQGRWFLSSSTDAHGNLIEYTYETVLGYAMNGAVASTPVDLSLTSISYGKNISDPASVHHAQIRFGWEAALVACPGSAVPIGAQFTYRTGIRRYEGARKLLTIGSYINTGGGQWTRRRELALQYSSQAESCTGQHAPLRQLSAVQLKAWGQTDPPAAPGVVLPPTTFSYAPLETTYPTTATGSSMALSAGKNPLNPAKPGGWPTLDTIVTDLEGNGIVKSYDGQLCQALPKVPWANGLAPAANAAPFYLAGWEGCSLTAQVTHRTTARPFWSQGLSANYYGYRFLDVNGDGRPDLLAELDYQKGAYRPTEDAAVMADYPACSTLPAPPCSEPNGERGACLFSTPGQMVMPLDSGFGNSGAPMSLALNTGGGGGGGGGGSCPDDADGPTCINPFCDPGIHPENPNACCSHAYCPKYGCDACPPAAAEDAFGPVGALQDYQGNPGGPVSEGIANLPPPPSNLRYGQVPDLHCGFYVYRVYLNESNGTNGVAFSSTPRVVRSPVPLDGMEMTTGSASHEMANVSGWRAIVDLDGDGRPDAVYQRPNYFSDLHDDVPAPLRFWRGSKSGVGMFVGASDGQGLVWHVPPSVDGHRDFIQASDSELFVVPLTPSTGRTFTQQRESVGLYDINGDGLADMVRREPGATPGTNVVRVFYNTGGGFETGPGTVLSTSLPGMSRRIRWPLRRNQSTPEAEDLELSVMSHRPADLDGDGLVDVIQVPEPNDGGAGHLDPLEPLNGATTAYYSTGDRFLAVDATASLGAFRRAFAQVTFSEHQAYRTVSDFTDMNGDGRPDMVMPDDRVGWCPIIGGNLTYDGCALVSKVYAAPSRPLGLLTRVTNGVGAQTDFAYAPMRDEAVVSRDAAHQRTSPAWVVKSVTVRTEHGAATTDYRYVNPVFNYDRLGRFGARGFETVVETGPAVASGRRSRTYTSYRYDLEETGLLRDTRAAEVFADGSEQLLAQTRSSYDETPLFGAAVRVYQPQDQIQATCAVPVTGTDDGSLAICWASAGVAHTTQTWSPLGSPGQPVAYAVSERRRFPSLLEADDVRREITEHELRDDANRYQLLVTGERTLDAGGAQLARSRTVFDAAGNPTEQRVYLDDTTSALTTRTFDVRGHVRTIMRPNQQGAFWPGEATITYDLYGVFPRVTTDELGHETVTVRDAATGVVLETQGPAEATGSRLDERMEIDGLGRILKRIRSVQNPATPKVPTTTILTATYVDSAPRSVTTMTLLESGSTPRWITTVVKLDADGHVVQEEEPSAAGTRVVTWQYDPSGHVVQVVVPDASGAGTRAYQTTYDGLGRAIHTTTPLDAPVDATYHGLTTIVEQQPAEEAPARRKVLTHDGFGRLVAVTEGVTTPATTTYTYDDADRIIQIVDADGLATALGYDQRGLRTSIVRGQTTLRYHYDLNGNRTSFVQPNGTLASISSWTYDALDRVITSTPAQRDWTTADFQRFGPDGVSTKRTMTYRYDDKEHGFGTGRLTHVETPVLTTDYAYTAEGFVAKEDRAWNIAPDGVVWSGTATQQMVFGPSGNVLSVAHADGQTSSVYTYDDRGRAARVDVRSGPVNSFSELQRNAAGVVVKRTTPTAGVVQTWSRDGEGRVTDTAVTGKWGCNPPSPCPLQVIAGETLAFDSVGAVYASTERGKGIALYMQYDERNQLVVVDTPTMTSDPYAARYQYSGAGRLLRATVTSDLPSAEVKPRDVTYDYTPRGATDTADPAAVRALRSVLTNQEVAALTYDTRGNLITKASGDGIQTFTYDGDGRLRQATNEAGCTELYYYDHTGDRVLTYRGGCRQPASVRHRFGGVELFHESGGSKTTSTADIALAGTGVLRVARNGTTGTVEQLFHGVLGSLLATIDTSGVGTARFGYAPFGETLYAEGPKVAAFDHRFNGKAHDAVSQLAYYGARYYDPLTLTWTQADPYYRFAPDAGQLEPRRMNLYTFSLNNPVRYVDPDGLDGQEQEPDALEAFMHHLEILNANGHWYGSIAELMQLTAEHYKVHTALLENAGHELGRAGAVVTIAFLGYHIRGWATARTPEEEAKYAGAAFMDAVVLAGIAAGGVPGAVIVGLVAIAELMGVDTAQIGQRIDMKSTVAAYRAELQAAEAAEAADAEVAAAAWAKKLAEKQQRTDAHAARTKVLSDVEQELGCHDAFGSTDCGDAAEGAAVFYGAPPIFDPAPVEK